MQIHCPYCGWRSHAEFDHGGDADAVRPQGDAPLADWLAYVYARKNPRGAYNEYWQHARGCRSWIRVTRDTLTHETGSSSLAGDDLRGDGA